MFSLEYAFNYKTPQHENFEYKLLLPERLENKRNFKSKAKQELVLIVTKILFTTETKIFFQEYHYKHPQPISKD